ncbi:MFS general substrate transporter [Thozetella sp. PMI_491]|nr:MFS general substrate transporter [Thozetella sp. PMI_491]
MDRRMALQIICAGYSFFVAGVSDGSIGTMIPYIIQAYSVSTTIVSSVYGTAFFGWLLAAASNAHLSEHLGLGAMLVLGCCLQILGSALRAWTPPFPLFAITFFFLTLGQGYQDSHSNTFVAGAKSAHRWLGFIHAMYSCGCLVGPFVANAVASSKDPSPWSLFYILPVGLSVLNLVLIVAAFCDTIVIKRPSTASPSTELQGRTLGDHAAPGEAPATAAMDLVKNTLRLPSFWLLSMFYFFYLGAALTAGGWVVQYLVDVRGGDLAKMGYVPAGYNGGSFLGRLFLPELINRFGDRRMIFLFCVICLGLQLCFWLIPNIIAASVAVTLFGMFSGPFFPVGMATGKRLFSEELRPTALAFVFVVAQCGGSLFPIITGVLASRVSVAVLQPILVGLIVAMGISWLLVPTPKSAGSAAPHEE